MQAFLLALYYTKHEIGLRMAAFGSMRAMSSALGGLVAYGIQNADVSIPNWRLLFIIEVISSP